MGSYPGAEVCELVGLFMLNKLRSNHIEAILYRDDGAIISHKTERENQLDVAVIRILFQEEDLKIIPEVNLKVLNFLDVTLDLLRNKYRSYNQPNNNPLYVHSSSNHPPNILKQIPKTVERRISDLSSSEEVFEREKGTYVDALKRSGYDANLTNPAPLKRKPGQGKSYGLTPHFVDQLKPK